MNRKNKWAGLVLCGMLACFYHATVLAAGKVAEADGEPDKKSWMGRVGSWVGLGGDDKDNKDSKVNKANAPSGSKLSKKRVPDSSDLLPDDFPGIAEYRLAMHDQRWENRPLHRAQEVYDLLGVSAAKGNALAMIRQYEMYLDNPVTSEGGKQFFRTRLEDACKKLYPVAVKGNADAQYGYARYCVKEGSMQARSWLSRALRQYRRLAQEQVPYAQLMTGRVYQAAGEKKTAQDWFVIAANNGSAEAVCKINPGVFYENRVWDSLDARLKKDRSCAAFQVLQLMTQTEDNPAVASAADSLLNWMPVGYTPDGFQDGGFSFSPEKKKDVVSQRPVRKLTASQEKKSDALVEKYKYDRKGFIEACRDKFDWKKLNIFSSD